MARSLFTTWWCFDVFASLKVWAAIRIRFYLTFVEKLVKPPAPPGWRCKTRPFDPEYVARWNRKPLKNIIWHRMRPDNLFHSATKVENKAYNPGMSASWSKGKSNELTDISEVSEQLNNAVMPTTLSKYVLLLSKKRSSEWPMTNDKWWIWVQR